MEIKNINDYCETIHLKFPELDISDIKRILLFGFKSLYLHNAYGGDVSICDSELKMYIGYLTNDSLKHFRHYINKLSLKIRVLNRKLKIPWNGYYYFAVSDKLQELIESLKKKRGRKRKNFNYGDVFLYKLKEDCEIREHAYKYIYRIPYASDFGFVKYAKNFNSDKAELIIKRDPLTFNDILTTNNKYTYGG